MTINIKVCVYGLCVTLSLGHKLSYPATGTLLRKQILNLCYGHYVMSATLKVPFFSSSTFHVLLMPLSQSDVYLILISKYFLGQLSLLRNYKFKSVADITLVLQTSYNLKSSFNFFLNFLDLSVLVLGIAMDLLYNQRK